MVSQTNRENVGRIPDWLARNSIPNYVQNKLFADVEQDVVGDDMHKPTCLLFLHQQDQW